MNEKDLNKVGDNGNMEKAEGITIQAVLSAALAVLSVYLGVRMC